MYKLTTEKYMMIADYIINTTTAERMAKISLRLREMLYNGEVSWVEYKGLMGYRSRNEAEHGYGAKVIELMNA